MTYDPVYYKKYRELNKDKLREKNKAYRQRVKEQTNKLSRDWRKKNVEKSLLIAAKYRAKTRGIEFDLDISDLSVPELCPVLGIRLDNSASGRQDNSPSIDRIDSSKGYIKGNVQIISWRANRLKSDGIIEEFERIIEYMSGYRDGK